MELVPDGCEITQDVRIVLTQLELQVILISAQAVLGGIDDWEYEVLLDGSKDELRGKMLELEQLGREFFGPV